MHDHAAPERHLLHVVHRQPAGLLVSEVADDRREPQRGERVSLRRDHADRSTRGARRHVQVEAEPAHFGDRVREVDAHLGLERLAMEVLQVRIEDRTQSVAQLRAELGLGRQWDPTALNAPAAGDMDDDYFVSLRAQVKNRATRNRPNPAV